MTVKAAMKQVAVWHRHLPKVHGGLFAVQVISPIGECVGVAIAANPPPTWQGRGKIVISRVAVVEDLPHIVSSDGCEHSAPACTKLYAALCQAAKALGYEEAWTYTLPEESGTSLRAAGFDEMGLTTGNGQWNRKSRIRAPAVRPEPKRRWRRKLRDPILLGVFA